jgi:hypothetical protein
VYQLPSPSDQKDRQPDVSSHLRGRVLFGKDFGFEYIDRHSEEGALIKTTYITEEFNFEKYKAYYRKLNIPMFLVSEKKEIQVFSTDIEPKPQPGGILIAMVYEESGKIKKIDE